MLLQPVLLSGTSSGIGEAAALAFSSIMCWNVLATARQAGRGRAAGRSARVLLTRVSTSPTLASIRRRSKRPRLCFGAHRGWSSPTAGVGLGGPLEAMPLDDILGAQLEVNVNRRRRRLLRRRSAHIETAPGRTDRQLYPLRPAG